MSQEVLQTLAARCHPCCHRPLILIPIPSAGAGRWRIRQRTVVPAVTRWPRQLQRRQPHTARPVPVVRPRELQRSRYSPLHQHSVHNTPVQRGAQARRPCRLTTRGRIRSDPPTPGRRPPAQPSVRSRHGHTVSSVDEIKWRPAPPPPTATHIDSGSLTCRCIP
jgi:hypothetical protein